MISRELAEKLKGAGLQWEPKEGDSCANHPNDKFCHTWLPSLSQLLSEIEKLGYPYSLYSWIDESEIEYEASLLMGYTSRSFYADTPEEAAGQALLWILKEGGSNA